MSRPVDVLKIMEREMRVIAATSGSHAAMDMQAARAAVAELVEAVKAHRYGESPNPDCGFQGCGLPDCRCERAEKADARVEAALAKFGGAL